MRKLCRLAFKPIDGNVVFLSAIFIPRNVKSPSGLAFATRPGNFCSSFCLSCTRKTFVSVDGVEKKNYCKMQKKSGKWHPGWPNVTHSIMRCARDHKRAKWNDEQSFIQWHCFRLHAMSIRSAVEWQRSDELLGVHWDIVSTIRRNNECSWSCRLLALRESNNSARAALFLGPSMFVIERETKRKSRNRESRFHHLSSLKSTSSTVRIFFLKTYFVTFQLISLSQNSFNELKISTFGKTREIVEDKK